MERSIEPRNRDRRGSKALRLRKRSIHGMIPKDGSEKSNAGIPHHMSSNNPSSSSKYFTQKKKKHSLTLSANYLLINYNYSVNSSQSHGVSPMIIAINQFF